MKINLLFVIESLNVAGAEKSLANLLNRIDYSKYSVDLQLFKYGGEFEAMLPPEVNLLPPLPYFEYTAKSLKSCMKTMRTKQEIRMLIGRIGYSLALRGKKYSNPQKAVLLWKHSRKCFEIYEKI